MKDSLGVCRTEWKGWGEAVSAGPISAPDSGDPASPTSVSPKTGRI